ncbi:hypothetical protein KZO01_06180 [Kurthia zopfii]|nr:hypothetical protein KZO01_06180 [Kurthia zopfii]
MDSREAFRIFIRHHLEVMSDKNILIYPKRKQRKSQNGLKSTLVFTKV